MIADVLKWVDKQHSEFMVPKVAELTHAEALEWVWGDVEFPEDIPEDASGVYARLSAPGYMDCTDWIGPFATETDALTGLYEMYGDE